MELAEVIWVKAAEAIVRTDVVRREDTCLNHGKSAGNGRGVSGCGAEAVVARDREFVWSGILQVCGSVAPCVHMRGVARSVRGHGGFATVVCTGAGVVLGLRSSGGEH